MFVRKIVGGITELATSTMRTSVHTAEKVIGHGKDTAVGAASAGTTVAGTVVRTTVGKVKPAGKAAVAAPGQAKGKVTEAAGKTVDKAVDKAAKRFEDPDTAAPSTDQVADKALADENEAKAPPVPPTIREVAPAKRATAKTPAKKTPVKKAPAKKTAAQKAAAKDAPSRKKATASNPRPVTAADLPLPVLPDEPPVDIVEQVLAAEEQGETGREGFATEPKGSSRDETHGEASLQPAELDEISEEMAEATAAGSVDIETPVGTTGADVGYNPDTAEADLQQPGTEPLLDPSLTKAVIADRQIGDGDADVRKG